MLCPFLSEPIVDGKLDKAQPCIASCALYLNGKCAISVLANKAIHDTKKSTK